MYIQYNAMNNYLYMYVVETEYTYKMSYISIGISYCNTNYKKNWYNISKFNIE